MKPGDLIYFKTDYWGIFLSGKIGLVTSVRRDSGFYGDACFDALVDNNLVYNLTVASRGIKVIE